MYCFRNLFSYLIIALSFLLQASNSYASVTLGGTRFIYNESDDSISVSISDRDKNPYLVQSWISQYTAPGEPKTNNSNTADIPFIVTPPLFKIEAGDSDILNIVKLDHNKLPSDRESIFYLNVKAIPGKIKDSKSSLMISVDSSMKIFYRPAKLEGPDANSAGDRITFKVINRALIISNPTPYFITFYSVGINGSAIKKKHDLMIYPFGQISIPISGKIDCISWRTLGDQGQITPIKKVNL